MDKMTRKLMTMHNALHPRDDIDNDISRKRERALAKYWRQHQFENTIQKSKERLITSVNNTA